MPARLTQEYVDAWLAEHRPDFKPLDGWTYQNAMAPIYGVCLVEGCGSKCSPSWNDMKNHDNGHCKSCGRRSDAVKKRAHAEEQFRTFAKNNDYKVLNFFTRKEVHKANRLGYQNKTCVSLLCNKCGHKWDTNSLLWGCSSCAEFGFDDSKPGAIYLIARSVDGVEQRGYGISNNWPTRIKGYEKFGWLPLDVMEFSDGQTARNTESMLNRVVAATAGRSVEPDNLKYRNKEAWSDGNGIPMFNSVWAFLCWAAPIDARGEVLV